MRLPDAHLGKIILVGLLIVGAAAALQVEVPNQVKTVPEGQAAKYAVKVTNDGSRQEQVDLSADSDINVGLSDNMLMLSPGESKTTWVLASPGGAGEGTYMIDLNVEGRSRSLALNVEKGASSLDLTNSYEEVTVEQGSSHEIKFIIRNVGKKEIENIVLQGDITDKFKPDYPRPFDLDPRESREVSVLIKVPEGHPEGEYD